MKVFEPFAEATATGGSRLPLDSVVEFYHAVASSGGANEPRVKRIVEHRLVGAPTVGVVVGMLFAGEQQAVFFEHDADFHIKRHIVGPFFGVVCVLYKLTLPWRISLNIYALGHEFRVKFVEHIEAAFEVNHRTYFAISVDEFHRRDIVEFRHAKVISTECAGDVYDAGTVDGGHVVAGNYAERIVAGTHPRNELAVVHTYQVGAHTFAHYFPRHEFVARLVVFERNFGGFGIEYRVEQRFSHYYGDFFAAIFIICVDEAIFDLRTYAQCSVRRQSPWGSGPCQEEGLSPA